VKESRSAMRARQKAANCLAGILADPDSPKILTDAIEDHIVKLARELGRVLFEPEVVRLFYPLMSKWADERGILVTESGRRAQLQWEQDQPEYECLDSQDDQKAH
jgi:hypothetical protein